MSHLFFADNLFLFVKAGEDQNHCIKKGLDSFYLASGQRVNFAKSLMLVSPNVNDQVAKRRSQMLGTPIKNELGCYLGHEILHPGWQLNAPFKANT